jgi:hypothetical protein
MREVRLELTCPKALVFETSLFPSYSTPARLMPEVGVEPTVSRLARRPLRPMRLPFRHSSKLSGASWQLALPAMPTVGFEPTPTSS